MSCSWWSRFSKFAARRTLLGAISQGNENHFVRYGRDAIGGATVLKNAPIVPYIPVSDVARARKFYEEKVGLKPKEEVRLPPMTCVSKAWLLLALTVEEPKARKPHPQTWSRTKKRRGVYLGADKSFIQTS